MSVDPQKLMIVGNWAFVVKDGKILVLQRNPEEVLGAGMWSTPGGKSERGDDCLANLKREVREEAGIEIKNPQFLLHKAWPRKDDWVMGFYWICEWESGDVRINHEHTDWKWVDEQEFAELFTSDFNREIFAKAFAFLKQNHV